MRGTWPKIGTGAWLAVGLAFVIAASSTTLPAVQQLRGMLPWDLPSVSELIEDLVSLAAPPSESTEAPTIDVPTPALPAPPEPPPPAEVPAPSAPETFSAPMQPPGGTEEPTPATPPLVEVDVGVEEPAPSTPLVEATVDAAPLTGANAEVEADPAPAPTSPPLLRVEAEVAAPAPLRVEADAAVADLVEAEVAATVDEPLGLLG